MFSAISKGIQLATSAIETARIAIVATLERVTNAIVALAEKVLVKFPQMQARLVQSIEASVAAAKEKLNRIASTLTQRMLLALNLYQKAVERALSLLSLAQQQVVNTVKNTVSAAVTGAKSTIATMGAFSTIVSDIAVNPSAWLNNLRASASDGVQNHLINLEKAHEGDRSVTRQERDRTSPTSRNDRRIDLEKDDNRINHHFDRGIDLEKKDDRTQNKNNRGINLDKDDESGQNNQPDRRNRIRLDKDNKDHSKRGRNKNSDLDLDKPVDKDRSDLDRTGKNNKDKDREKDDNTEETLAQKQQRVREAVRTAVTAVNSKYGGRGVSSRQLSSILNPIKLRYELVYLKAITTGEKWLVKGKVNPTYKDLTDSFDKEGVRSEVERLFEKALESLRNEYYKGNSDPKDLESKIKDLPEMQKTIARIQNKYFAATEGANNTFSVGGHQFFVDQARNNYVYPLSAAKKAGIITKDGKVTTEKEVKGYDYRRFSGVTMGGLRNLLDQIQRGSKIGGRNIDRTAILIASTAAEPLRYPPSHLTNLIGLDYRNKELPAFDNMAMTTGGTDPTSEDNKKNDTINNPKVGTVPIKVRDRQFNMLRNDPDLNNEIEPFIEYYEEFPQEIDKNTEKLQLIGKFQNIIRKRIAQIQ